MTCYNRRNTEIRHILWYRRSLVFWRTSVRLRNQIFLTLRDFQVINFITYYQSGKIYNEDESKKQESNRHIQIESNSTKSMSSWGTALEEVIHLQELIKIKNSIHRDCLM